MELKLRLNNSALWSLYPSPLELMSIAFNSVYLGRETGCPRGLEIGYGLFYLSPGDSNHPEFIVTKSCFHMLTIEWHEMSLVLLVWFPKCQCSFEQEVASLLVNAKED